jgi:hypothetical protein
MKSFIVSEPIEYLLELLESDASAVNLHVAIRCSVVSRCHVGPIIPETRGLQPSGGSIGVERLFVLIPKFLVSRLQIVQRKVLMQGAVDQIGLFISKLQEAQDPNLALIP